MFAVDFRAMGGVCEGGCGCGEWVVVIVESGGSVFGFQGWEMTEVEG